MSECSRLVARSQTGRPIFRIPSETLLPAAKAEQALPPGEQAGALLKHPARLLKRPTRREPKARVTCQDCHGTFADNISLKRHQKRAHVANPPRFACDHPGCKKSYSTRIDLKYHVSGEHSKTPINWLCKYCGRPFTIRGTRNQHQREAHKGGRLQKAWAEWGKSQE